MRIRKTVRWYNLFSLILLSSVLFSCKLDPGPSPLPEPLSQTVKTLLAVEELTTEVESYVRGVWAYGNTYPGCATVAIRNVEDEAGIWFETTLDYGAGTRCEDGNTRSGKVIMRRKVTHRQEAVAWLEQYHVNGLKLEGTFTFLQLDEPGKKFALTAAVTDGKMEGDGTSAQFRLTRKSFWNEGTATPDDVSDDITEVFGATYSLSLKNEPLAQGTLAQPLIWKRGCQAQAGYRPVQGSILLEWADGNVSGIDFGGGTCGAKPVGQ